MPRVTVRWFVFVLLVMNAGCGRTGSNSSEHSAVASPAAATVAVSPFDAGPRAADTPFDESKIATGQGLFQDKGCSACHTFGKRMSGPDLVGVTHRRTATWMQNQILHPEKMVKEDPISRQMFAQFALQMPNQGLTPEQALAVIEFLKHKNHEIDEAGPRKEQGK